MKDYNYKRRNHKGQVLLEFAIGLPLLLTLLFFVAEAGYYLAASQAVPTALHDTAVLALTRSSYGKLNQSECPLLKASIIKSMSRPGIGNVTALVTANSVGKIDSKRTRVVLEVTADYTGITPLRKQYPHTRPWRIHPCYPSRS